MGKAEERVRGRWSVRGQENLREMGKPSGEPVLRDLKETPRMANGMQMLKPWHLTERGSRGIDKKGARRGCC